MFASYTKSGMTFVTFLLEQSRDRQTDRLQYVRQPAGGKVSYKGGATMTIEELQFQLIY